MVIPHTTYAKEEKWFDFWGGEVVRNEKYIERHQHCMVTMFRCSEAHMDG
jgi:hypothetical protein